MHAAMVSVGNLLSVDSKVKPLNEILERTDKRSCWYMLTWDWAPCNI